mgnify:CR=1 FL=1
MAYVISSGELAGLEKRETPRVGSLSFSPTYTATYGEIWKAQPQVRTVVDFLARNLAQIGLHLFRRVSDTDRERVTDHPLAKLIGRPNPRMTQYRFVDSLVHDVGIYDVACFAKLKADDGSRSLFRLPPAMLSPIGESWLDLEGVKLKGTRGSREFALDDVLLFRGYSPTGVWGTPPMETLRQILLESWNASTYRSQLWSNGARFAGIIERPKEAKWSPTAREQFRGDWNGLYTGDGPGAGGTPILEDGMKFVPNAITPQQAEYTAARKLTREEAAAAYHVPLPMVGILEHATFSNIKEQHQQLYQDCLGPWLVMLQQELVLQLVPDFTGTDEMYFEFNLDAKMRGSFEEQAGVMQTMVGGPVMTRNEGRARLNLPRLEGGDELIVPMNVITGGQASPTDSAPKAAAVAQVLHDASVPAAVTGPVLVAADPWSQLPDSHPDRAKQCRVCGTIWISKTYAQGCELKHTRNDQAERDELAQAITISIEGR